MCENINSDPSDTIISNVPSAFETVPPLAEEIFTFDNGFNVFSSTITPET